MSENFEELYHLQKKRVYNLALHYVLSEDDAADIAQDVFIKLFEKTHLFRNQSETTTWVYRITVNTCIDFLRRKKRHALKQRIFLRDQSSIVSVHPGLELENKELGMKIFELIDTLPRHQKSCFILFEIEQLKQHEIAAILGLNIKAVESLLFRARKFLRQHLTSE